jgi:hypothetical protein
MSKRLFNLAQTATLTLALLWTLGSCQSQPQEGQTIHITPVHTQAQRHTATQAAHTHTPVPETPILRQDQASTPEQPGSTPAPPTATPIPSSPTPSSSSSMTTTMTTSPTPKPTLIVLNPYLRIEKEVWADVDLNCDGLEERVMTIEQYSGNPASDNPDHDGTVGLALQVPAQQGHNQVWEYMCKLTRHGYPGCIYTTVELLATDNCEQLIVFQGSFHQGGWQQRVKIFRWDGKDMSLVLDALGSEFESTQDPFSVTTIIQDCDGPGKCRETGTNYLWNGAKFERE